MTPAPAHRPPKRRRHLPPITHAAVTSRTPAPAEGATTAVAMLPYDLIFEILSRVPVRSACRFRCVSKRWCALISDPTFLSAHKSLHNEPLIISFSWKNQDGGRDLQLMDMEGHVVRMTKGVGGMVLPSSSLDDHICILDDYDAAVHMIDPVTGEVLEGSRQHLDTRYKSSKFGFGYGRAVPSGVYKVVQLESDLTCKVFTLGDDTTWRHTQLPPTHTWYNQNYPVAVNGVMYFLVARSIDDRNLLCFYLESEEWIKMIDGPQEVVGHDLGEMTRITGIAALNGALCMVQVKTHKNVRNRYINIWLLTDFDNEIWIKAYTIPLAPYTYDYMPLRMANDGGKLIFYCSVHRQGHALKVYDPHTRTSTTLRLLDNMADRIDVCRVHLDRLVSAKIGVKKNTTDMFPFEDLPSNTKRHTCSKLALEGKI